MREPAGQLELPGGALLPRTRAVRIPPSFDPEKLQAQISQAAQAGFNTVVVEAFSRGFPTYPSHVCTAAGLPRLHPRFRHFDCIAHACRAARREGLSVYASVTCLDAGARDQSPVSPFVRRHSDMLLRGRPGRLFPARPWRPRAGSDEQKNLWICPSSPTVRRLLAGIATELSASYPIDGILLESLAYPPSDPDNEFCGCRSCQKRVRAELGIDLRRDWPRPGSEAHERWSRWRAGQLTELVGWIKSRARKGRRSVRIAGLPVERTGVPETDPTRLAVQDWLRDGLLDVYVTGEPEAPAGERLADLRWGVVRLHAGRNDWQFHVGTDEGRDGILTVWEGEPDAEDWQRVQAGFPSRVPPLESSPLEHARLFLLRATELGCPGCEEAAELAAAIAEQDRPTEPVGARLDRLLNLSEVIERIRSAPDTAEHAAADSHVAALIRSHLTTAAGLIRLAILTV